MTFTDSVCNTSVVLQIRVDPLSYLLVAQRICYSRNSPWPKYTQENSSETQTTTSTKNLWLMCFIIYLSGRNILKRTKVNCIELKVFIFLFDLSSFLLEKNPEGTRICLQKSATMIGSGLNMVILPAEPLNEPVWKPVRCGHLFDMLWKNDITKVDVTKTIHLVSLYSHPRKRTV